VEAEAVLLAEAAQVVDFNNISTSGFNMPLVFSLLCDTVVYRTFTLVARMLKANALVVKGANIDFRFKRTLSAGRAVSLLGRFAICGVSPVPQFPLESPHSTTIHAVRSNQQENLSIAYC
jgi:hypothetical protein